MIQARNKWIVFCPGESKMDAVTGNLLRSAYQQQNEQWKKPSIKEETKATELTLKNTKGKAEGTQTYLQHVSTQGNFSPWQESLI